VILSESELVAAVTRDRAAGKRIGFISVAFDLLKVGVVRAVQAADEKCDRLVIAVVDDRSSRVMTASDRAEMVDNLRGVDYVIICAPDRLEPLTAVLLPDVRA
jgi:bifunctional ADP-heptose synthase (sugar kinase/adenylyltransferase)